METAHCVPQHVRLLRPQQKVPSVHGVSSAVPLNDPPHYGVTDGVSNVADRSDGIGEARGEVKNLRLDQCRPEHMPGSSTAGRCSILSV